MDLGQSKPFLLDMKGAFIGNYGIQVNMPIILVGLPSSTESEWAVTVRISYWPERKKHWEYILNERELPERRELGQRNRNRIPTLAFEADSCGIDRRKEVR